MLLLLLNLMNLVQFGICYNQITVLEYNQRSDCPNSVVGIPMKSNSPLQEFTFCGRYNFRFLRECVLMGFDKQTWFWMMINDEEKAALKLHGEYFFFNINKQNMMPDQWQHLCFSVSLQQVKIVLNGEIVCNEPVTLDSEEIAHEIMWIGGMKVNSWHIDRRIEGTLTDVNVWNRSLEIQYLLSITSNGKMDTTVPAADIFSWIKFELQSNTSCVEYIIKDEHYDFYEEKHEENVLVEHLSDFNTSNYLCQALGGNLLVPRNDQDIDEIDALMDQSGKCLEAFLGLLKVNGSMVEDLIGEAASYMKWGKNQPNGKEFQKCIAIYDSSIVDERCDIDACFACQMKAKIFTLRGNLSKSMERRYFVNIKTKQVEIRGLLKTDCFWQGTWNFGQYLMLDGNTSDNLPPVGLRKWNHEKMLKFTHCDKAQFTCHTYGNCISIDKRCDGHPDCPEDGSDENECKIMTLAKGYDKKYPPVENITTLISVTVSDIVAINELDMSYIIKVQIALEWFDSRIIFRNLKPSAFENQLNNLEIDRIWTPKLFMQHSNEIYMEAGGKDEGVVGFVRVKKEGSPYQNELSEIDEDYLYPGKENPIIMKNYFTIKLGCKFDLVWYVYN